MARWQPQNEEPENQEGELPTYSLRISVRAHRDTENAEAYLAAKMLGEDPDGEMMAEPLTDTARIRRAEVAAKVIVWSDGLDEMNKHLSIFPRTYANDLAFSKRIKQEVRRAVYRRPGAAPASVAYHVYFSVVDEGLDGPLVTILHTRHAARHSPTDAEIADILAEQ